MRNSASLASEVQQSGAEIGETGGLNFSRSKKVYKATGLGSREIVQIRAAHIHCQQRVDQSSGHAGRSACCAAAELEAASALAAPAAAPAAAVVVASAASTVPASGPSAAPAAAPSSAPAAAPASPAAPPAADTSPSGGATLARHTGHSGLVCSQASTQAAWNVWPQPGSGLRGGASGGSGAA